MDLVTFDATTACRRTILPAPTYYVVSPKPNTPTNTLTTRRNGERDYTYDALLTRFYLQMSERGYQAPDTPSLPQPTMVKNGSKRVCWLNFHRTCSDLNRDPYHVAQFIRKEWATTVTIGDEKLTITGRYSVVDIQKLLVKYVTEYARCAACKSFDTCLEKRNRLVTRICSRCGGCVTVSIID